MLQDFFDFIFPGRLLNAEDPLKTNLQLFGEDELDISVWRNGNSFLYRVILNGMLVARWPDEDDPTHFSLYIANNVINRWDRRRIRASVLQYIMESGCDYTGDGPLRPDFPPFKIYRTKDKQLTVHVPIDKLDVALVAKMPIRERLIKKGASAV